MWFLSYIVLSENKFNESSMIILGMRHIEKCFTIAKSVWNVSQKIWFDETHKNMWMFYTQPFECDICLKLFVQKMIWRNTFGLTQEKNYLNVMSVINRSLKAVVWRVTWEYIEEKLFGCQVCLNPFFQSGYLIVPSRVVLIIKNTYITKDHPSTYTWKLIWDKNYLNLIFF